VAAYRKSKTFFSLLESWKEEELKKSLKLFSLDLAHASFSLCLLHS